MKRKSIPSLFVLLMSMFLFVFSCAYDQKLIPPNQIATADLANPEVSDGFGYPLRNYYPMKQGFLEKNERTHGCPISYHPGEDVGSSPNTPIYSASNGRVVFAAFQNNFSGYIVVIEHTCPPGIKFKIPGGGEADKVWSAYYHMAKIDEENVALNKVVSRGKRIGFLGDFPHGSNERHHLHFEIRKINMWNGSAYISAGNREYTLCKKPKEWVAEKFVCPSKFIKLNRPN